MLGIDESIAAKSRYNVLGGILMLLKDVSQKGGTLYFL
jgi:hypothetical protein